MGFVLAAKKSEVPPGTIRELQVEGKAVALANVGGQFHAIDGICLHRTWAAEPCKLLISGAIGSTSSENKPLRCEWAAERSISPKSG